MPENEAEFFKDGRVTTIKVVGVGGAGCNAVDRMIQEGIRNVDFIAVNTDQQVLQKSLAPIKLTIGQRSTRGLGAGAKPEVGERAAQEDIDAIKQSLEGADMVFITAGMGGGTGTGASPIFAKVAKEMGALTVAVVTIPFEFEGNKRYAVARQGIERLKEHVDTMLIITNSRILKIIDRKTPIKDAFRKIDEVLKQAVQGISDIISDVGIVNVDFADVKTVLSNKGEAIMGIGIAHGENRAVEAAKMAMENPLIENNSFKNAGAMLVVFIGGTDFPMEEYDEAAKTISSYCRPGAEIIMGVDIDENLKDKVKVIVVATDFSEGFEEEIDSRPLNEEDIFEDRGVIDVVQRQKQRGDFRRLYNTPYKDIVNKAEPKTRENDWETPTFIRNKSAQKLG
ncbi:MAG: cell division protein FtsZ [Spirochaetes bacterium GWF1_51_8]|nr:MAG: cell division protein FtsZ [Spirochaetes bacterium GWF1_51_8]